MSGGRVVVLNGAPSSGRSSIAAALGWTAVGDWAAAAAAARAGARVVVETALSEPAEALAAARELQGIDVLFVGVRCPLAVVLARLGLAGEQAPTAVARAQSDVHALWDYDLEVDTSVLSPEESARDIGRTLVDPPVPSAFARLATVAP